MTGVAKYIVPLTTDRYAVDPDVAGQYCPVLSVCGRCHVAICSEEGYKALKSATGKELVRVEV